jgi:hypothetical protein
VLGVRVPDTVPADARAQIAEILRGTVTLEIMASCTIVRCPRCGSTDAGEQAERSIFEIRFMMCASVASVSMSTTSRSRTTGT